MFDTLTLKRFARRFIAAIATLALTTPPASAWTTPGPESVLYAFHGPDGSTPYQLVEGADGTLFGATLHDGAYGPAPSSLSSHPPGV